MKKTNVYYSLMIFWGFCFQSTALDSKNTSEGYDNYYRKSTVLWGFINYPDTENEIRTTILKLENIEREDNNAIYTLILSGKEKLFIHTTNKIINKIVDTNGKETTLKHCDFEGEKDWVELSEKYYNMILEKISFLNLLGNDLKVGKEFTLKTKKKEYGNYEISCVESGIIRKFSVAGKNKMIRLNEYDSESSEFSLFGVTFNITDYALESFSRPFKLHLRFYDSGGIAYLAIMDTLDKETRKYSGRICEWTPEGVSKSTKHFTEETYFIENIKKSDL